MLTTAWSGPQDAAKLASLTKGGPAQWPQWIETKGAVGQGKPFATDTIGVPFQNPYGALMFLSGLDFFADGTAAVCTMTGEVWLVRGLDTDLKNVRWKRFATGLHQPLGVRIIQNRLYVLGRDQVTRLHDLNGDDEADFYESVTNGYATSNGGHDYVIGLEADARGNFYTSSGNQGMLRLSGRQGVEVLATGLRNPNGTGMSADGRFFTSSLQEGNWTPASAIVQVEVGKDQGVQQNYAETVLGNRTAGWADAACIARPRADVGRRKPRAKGPRSSPGTSAPARAAGAASSSHWTHRSARNPSPANELSSSSSSPRAP